jgi:hypothetical protein
VLKALDAKIIRTPTEVPSESPDSHIGVAQSLNREVVTKFGYFNLEAVTINLSQDKEFVYIKPI